MSELGHDPPGVGTRSSWGAIAWAEGFLIAGLVLGAFAVASSFDSCDVLGGCGPDESSLGAASVIWLVLAGAAVVAGLVLAAHRSGWAREQAALRVVLGLGGAVAALLAGGALANVLTDEYSPGLVLAVGVAGLLTIRPPGPRATWGRAIAAGLFYALALVLANETAAIAALVVVVLPGLGLADSLSTPRP